MQSDWFDQNLVPLADRACQWLQPNRSRAAADTLKREIRRLDWSYWVESNNLDAIVRLATDQIEEICQERWLYDDPEAPRLSLCCARGREAGGHVKVHTSRQSKRGRVFITGDGASIANIHFTESGPDSKMTIQVKEGDGRITLGSLAADAGVGVGSTYAPDADAGVGVGSTYAPDADLLGDLSVSGSLHQLVLNDIVGENPHALTIGGAAGDRPLGIKLGAVRATGLVSGLPVRSLVVDSWTHVGGSGLIATPQIGRLISRGDFQVSLQMATQLDGSEGAIGSIVAPRWMYGGVVAGSIGAIKITGDADRGLLGDFGAGLELTDTIARRSLRSLRVAGWLDAASIRSAGSIGSIRAGGLRDSQVLVGVEDELSGLPDQLDDF